MLQTPKHRQIRRLGDPNPMDDAPDQDSAQIQVKKFKLYFAYPSNPGNTGPKDYCEGAPLFLLTPAFAADAGQPPK